MTFQPPPPPPPSPGGPPAGGWGPPAGGPAKFDPKTVNPLDWGIVGAGALAFIFSLFSYYTVSISVKGFGGGSDSSNAWSGGFFGWAAALLALAGAAAVAIHLFAPQVKLPVAARLAALGAFALATLFVILALFVGGYDDQGISGVDTGHGIGYWLSLIVIIAGLALSLMRFQATGGQLPGGMQGKIPNVGGYGPQGGISGGSPHPGPGQNPPPPPGYGPPQ